MITGKLDTVDYRRFLWDMGGHWGFTGGNWLLQEVFWGYKWLQGVIGDTLSYRSLM